MAFEPDRLVLATDDALEAAFRAFIAAIVQEFVGSAQQIAVAPAVPRFFLLPDGATQLVEVKVDCNFLGGAIVYGSGQFTATVDGTTQTQSVSGTFRELSGLISASGTTHGTLGKVRIPMHKGQKISIGVNAGPQLVCLLFDR